MRRILLLGTLGLLAGHAAGIDRAAAQPADTSAITAANAAYYAALTARDIAALERIWAKDEQVSNIFAAAKAPSFGPGAVKADYTDLFKRLGDSPSLTMVGPSIRQQGDMAVVIGIEAVQVKLPTGEVAKAFPVATNIFVRRDGQWLMVHHHTSRPAQ